MLIENGISEAVQFFHIDALSSMVGMKVDFDMQLTLAASSLYRMMAQRIGREYSHSQAKTVFRNLLDLSGKVEVTSPSVVVTIDKRARIIPIWSPPVWPTSPHRCLGRRQEADHSICLSPDQSPNRPIALSELFTRGNRG
jgi:hypothetical protein